MRKILQKMLMIMLGLAVALLFTAPWMIWREELQRCAPAGYAGLFLSCLLANASVFLPASSTMFVLAASTTLQPWLCILVGGLGTALGEQASYLCGVAGRKGLRSDSPWVLRLRGWMQRNAFITVFLFALAPLPLFDFAGVAAGVTRMNWFAFTLAAVLGKVLKFTLMVGFAFWFVPWYVSTFSDAGSAIFRQILAALGVNLLP